MVKKKKDVCDAARTWKDKELEEAQNDSSEGHELEHGEKKKVKRSPGKQNHTVPNPTRNR